MHAMKVNKGFSQTDKIILFICQSEKLLMLTGEGLMRKYCKRQNLEVRGIIWLFDHFLEYNLITPAIAIDRMKQLLLLNNRLPIMECQNRLVVWERLIS